MEAGKLTVHLGQNLYKVRTAKEGKGKSGGYRTFIIFRKDFRVIFVFGLDKNERDNIDEDEEKALKELGKTLLSLSSDEAEKNIKAGGLIDIGEVEK